MFARLFSIFTFDRSEAEPRKPDTPAFTLGYETAMKKRGDTVNPYPAGTQEHADWEEGQFIADAQRQW